MPLQELGVDLEQEDDYVGFLGVTLDQESKTGLIDMKQTGLIQRIIEALFFGRWYGEVEIYTFRAEAFSQGWRW